MPSLSRRNAWRACWGWRRTRYRAFFFPCGTITRPKTAVLCCSSWQLATKTAYAPDIKDIMDTRRNTPLSPAALEVLAIIAYNQPVSRSFIEQVRGVDSSSTVQTLVQKGLIEEAGRLDLPGRPVSFRTTDVFLRTFGIASLAELPPLHGDDYAEMEEAAGEAAYSGDEDADGAQAFAPKGDV